MRRPTTITSFDVAEYAVDAGYNLLMEYESYFKAVFIRYSYRWFDEQWDEAIDRAPRVFELWDPNLGELEMYFKQSIIKYARKRVAREWQRLKRFESTPEVRRCINDDKESVLEVQTLKALMDKVEFELLEDRYCYGMTIEELAYMHGVSFGTMQARCVRALAHARNLLGVE